MLLAAVLCGRRRTPQPPACFLCARPQGNVLAVPHKLLPEPVSELPSVVLKDTLGG